MEFVDKAKELLKMWTWLYKHPAHDREYYIAHVAKLDKAWSNSCPFCELEMSGGKCAKCHISGDEMKDTFCCDQESPLSKWKATDVSDPNNRTYYAGEVISVAKNLKG